MEIMNGTVCFKSEEPMFWKELIGVKPNTSRRIPADEIDRYSIEVNPLGYMTFKTFSAFENISPAIVRKIQITNSVSGQSFTRELIDVTPYDGRFIFSWVK